MESELCQVISYLKSQLAERDATIARLRTVIESSKSGIQLDRDIEVMIEAKFENHVIHDKVVELCDMLLNWKTVMRYHDNEYTLIEDRVSHNMKHIYRMLTDIASLNDGLSEYFACIQQRLPYKLFEYIRINKSWVRFSGITSSSNECITTDDVKKLVMDIRMILFAD